MKREAILSCHRKIPSHQSSQEKKKDAPIHECEFNYYKVLEENASHYHYTLTPLR